MKGNTFFIQQNMSNKQINYVKAKQATRRLPVYSIILAKNIQYCSKQSFVP